MFTKKIFVFTVCATFILTGIAYGEMSGLEIMKKVDDRDDGDTRKSTAEMILVSKSGKQRVRETVSISKDVPEGTKSISTFLKPADVAGTSFLQYTYDEIGKDDDQWLYLPSLKKVRRITSSSKGDYFMGTEFTYDDMGDRKPEEDNHKMLGTETVNGRECYKVLSTPKEEDYMYAKKIAWIDKSTYLPLKVDFYDEDEELLKVMTTSDPEMVDNIWVTKEIEMKNVQKGRATLIKTKDIQFNVPVKDNMFSKRMLKKGIKE
ncbi:MAG: outer membrane lipoprotein-sorting protein [Deltaproteobacteria bacterium]|nr:outer membrane lipoprotein-sorting protein [Deltaproteobacteria bacterium]